MKYRKLPIEKELGAILDEKDMARVRGAAFLETARTRGFQLVTVLLRDVEALAMHNLKYGRRPERALGWIECVEEIRRCLTAMLPGVERENVQWFDEAQEEFVLLNDGSVAGEGGEE